MTHLLEMKIFKKGEDNKLNCLLNCELILAAARFRLFRFFSRRARQQSSNTSGLFRRDSLAALQREWNGILPAMTLHFGQLGRQTV